MDRVVRLAYINNTCVLQHIIKDIIFYSPHNNIPLRFHQSVNTEQTPNVGLMLVQRRRRWANIDPTLSECLVFAG